MSEPLPARDVAHLWVARPEELEASPEAHALMDPVEAAQQRRFVFPEHRHEYLATRVLVRRVLGAYLGAAPAALRFTRNEHGRPELTEPPSPLRFNLSNTPGLVVCLVSAEHEVGVDTELRTRAGNILGLARTVFAEVELRELMELEQGARERRAVTLWTLKEAYIKARGMGLALPLEKFAFRFDVGTRIEIDETLRDDPARWQFRTLELGPHVVSTAIASPPKDEVEILVRELPR